MGRPTVGGGPGAVRTRVEQLQAQRSHERFEAALGLVREHCDIEARLAAIPPSAKVRGLYLKSIPALLAPLSKDDAYRDYFPGDAWSSMRMYPLKDYLVRLAVAGALVATPKDVHAGMHQLSWLNAQVFARSLLGKAIFRLLSRDPVRLCEQGLAARRQTLSHGHWEIVRLGPQAVEMQYQEEYIWIESAIAGGAVGTFESCGMQVQLETRLIDRFNGSTVIRW